MFQPQIDPVQNCETFPWAVISKTCPRIIRSKIFFRISNISVRAYMPACSALTQVAHLLKSYGHLSDLGVEITLSHRHVDFFRVKANTSIHGLGGNIHLYIYKFAARHTSICDQLDLAYSSKQCIIFVQCRANVVQMLYKYFGFAGIVA